MTHEGKFPLWILYVKKNSYIKAYFSQSHQNQTTPKKEKEKFSYVYVDCKTNQLQIQNHKFEYSNFQNPYLTVLNLALIKMLL